MKSLDTDIVLRLLLQDHPVQSPQITDMIERSGPNSFGVADVIIFECVWILQGPAYQFDRDLIADLLARFIHIDQINCNRTLFERVLPLFVKHPAVSFIDLALAVYADLNNALPLLTYDKKLVRQLPQAELPA